LDITEAGFYRPDPLAVAKATAPNHSKRLSTVTPKHH